MEYKSGSYTQQYKPFEQEHLNTLRHAHQSGRHEALLRSKKLQHETNKRRKAQAIKRKLEAQREEKRRQEILVKRKQEIQEATERFQRLNKTYSKDEQEEDNIFHPRQATPGLEDALHAVRGSSAGSRRPARQSSAGTRIHSATARQHALGRQDSNSSVHGSHSATNVRDGGTVGEEARTGSAGRRRRPGSAKSLHDKSLRNLTNSRSLFEQQLEQHQQLLMDQQQQSLFQFNEAILMEMEKDKKLRGEEEDDGMGDASVLRTESLSSVDSLEEGRKENGATEIPNQSGAAISPASYGSSNVSNLIAKSSTSPVTSSNVNSSNPPGFVLHRSSSSSSSNVAIVQPMTTTNHQEPPKKKKVPTATLR